MFKSFRWLRVGFVAVVAVVTGAYPVYAGAATAMTLNVVTEPAVIITEVQTNGGTAAQEFVEFYNTTDQDIVFSDAEVTGLPQWKLQFFNSTSVKAGTPAWETAASGSNSITLTGMISAHDYYVLSSADYKPADTEPDQFYSPTSSRQLTDTGGGLQLLSTTAVATTSDIHDRVMWLKADPSSTLPDGVHATPKGGKSLQRLSNDDDEYDAPEGGLMEFAADQDITPMGAWQPPVEGSAPEGPVDTVTEGETLEEPASASGNTGLAAPEIIELLPNPGSPLTDASDEFIELYNPNNAAFHLKGYALQVGTTTLHTFIFTEEVVLPPLGHQAFYSADTKLSLANGGGQARLLDTAGVKISETDAYGTATDNQAWILAEGAWQWTTAASPGLANVLAVPVAAAKSTTTKSATTKAPTAKKAAATKAKTAKAKSAAKTPKAKKAKAAKVKKAKKEKTKKATALSSAAITKTKPPIHTGILVAVGVAALLYGLYEYRHDISNKFRQLRQNRAARRRTGGQAAWRRGYSTD